MQQQLPGPQPSLGFWLRALRLVFGVYGAAAFAALLARHALCAGAGQPLVAWPAMTESSHAVVAVCVLLLALLAGLELRAAWAGGRGAVRPQLRSPSWPRVRVAQGLTWAAWQRLQHGTCGGLTRGPSSCWR